jgi:hypothetical protein
MSDCTCTILMIQTTTSHTLSGKKLSVIQPETPPKSLEIGFAIP